MDIPKYGFYSNYFNSLVDRERKTNNKQIGQVRLGRYVMIDNVRLGQVGFS